MAILFVVSITYMGIFTDYLLLYEKKKILFNLSDKLLEYSNKIFVNFDNIPRFLEVIKTNLVKMTALTDHY